MAIFDELYKNPAAYEEGGIFYGLPTPAEAAETQRQEAAAEAAAAETQRLAEAEAAETQRLAMAADPLSYDNVLADLMSKAYFSRNMKGSERTELEDLIKREASLISGTTNKSGMKGSEVNEVLQQESTARFAYLNPEEYAAQVRSAEKNNSNPFGGVEGVDFDKVVAKDSAGNSLGYTTNVYRGQAENSALAAQMKEDSTGFLDDLSTLGSQISGGVSSIFSDMKDDFAYLASGDAFRDVKDDLISSYDSIVDGSAFTGKDTATSTAAPAQTFGEAFNAAFQEQGEGGVFTYDGKQYTTDLAPAGMDSVISTGGPGTFAPGSLPASTGTSALDGYTQLANTMRDSGSLDLSGRTGSEAFSTGMAGDGSAAVATGDLSAAEILNNQLNTIQPLKISTDVGAPLSTDIDNIDSAIIAAAQDDAKKNGFDLDTEQGMDEVDRILGERSDYDKLLAVAMDPMNSGYTDAMETLVTDYGVDANVIAIEADKALTEKEESESSLKAQEDSFDMGPIEISASDQILSNVEAIKNLPQDEKDAFFKNKSLQMLPESVLNALQVLGLAKKEGENQSEEDITAAEAILSGAGPVIKDIVNSNVVGAIKSLGNIAGGLDESSDKAVKYLKSNYGEDLAPSAEYDTAAKAFLSGQGFADDSELASTSKTDAALTRARLFSESYGKEDSFLREAANAMDIMAQGYADSTGLKRGNASIEGDTFEQLSINGNGIEFIKTISEEVGEEATELALAQMFRKQPLMLAIVSGLSTGEAIEAGREQSIAVINELDEKGELKNTAQYKKYLAEFDNNVEKTKAFLADEISYQSILKVGTIGFADAFTNALKMGKVARLATEAGQEGIQEGIEGWAVLDAANTFFDDIDIDTLENLAGNIATGAVVGTGTAGVYNAAESTAKTISNAIKSGGDLSGTGPVVIRNETGAAMLGAANNATASETLLTGDPGLGGDNFTASENLMANSMADALSTANVSIKDRAGGDTVLTNLSTGLQVTIPAGTDATLLDGVVKAVDNNDDLAVTDIIKNAKITDIDLTRTDDDTITKASEMTGLDSDKMALEAANAGKKFTLDETGGVVRRNTGNAELIIGGVDINNLKALDLSLDLDGAAEFNAKLADGSLTAADLQNARTEMENAETNTIETVDTSGIAGLGSEEQYELNLTGGTGTQLTDVGNTGIPGALTQEQLNAITGKTDLDVNALTTSQADVVTGTDVLTNQTVSVTNAQDNNDGTFTGTDVATGNTITVTKKANQAFNTSRTGEFGQLVNVDPFTDQTFDPDVQVTDDTDPALNRGLDQSNVVNRTNSDGLTAVELMNISEGEGEVIPQTPLLPFSNFKAPTGMPAFTSMGASDPNQIVAQQTSNLLMNAYGGGSGLASFPSVSPGYSAYNSMPAARGPGAYGFAGTQNFRTAPQSYGGGYDPSTLTSNLQQSDQTPMASEDLLSQEASFNR